TRGCHHGKAALRSAQQAATPGIVGVFAEELDAAGHPPREQVASIRRKRGERAREERRLRLELGGAQPRVHETRRERRGGVAQSFTFVPRRRAATAGTSPRCERSRTVA